MLEFKKTEIGDIENFKKYMGSPKQLSCENALVNLVVWQEAYNNMWAEKDGQLIIKSGDGEHSSFRLPFGDDFSHGIELIREYSGKEYPNFWVQEGERLNSFKKLFGDSYAFEEKRDAFDYIYLRSDLAELSGKKYHSKRNHISAFSKSFSWKYREITEENKEDIRLCAEEWYKENSDRIDKYMLSEKKGIGLMLDNMSTLNIKGGAIYVDGRAVAFTLGSPINEKTFDIHIEKALKDYAEGYTVINREFAKTLEGYELINREDDMGLEGLRRAKLSYKPHILLKKYSCRKKAEPEEVKKLYRAAFGEEDKAFEDRLFSVCKDYILTEKCGEEIASMLFLLPCDIAAAGEKTEAYYLYAAATAEPLRGKGYMTRLIERVKKIDKPIFLKPANEGLVAFYKALGFEALQASYDAASGVSVLPKGGFEDIAYKEEKHGSYTAMCIGVRPAKLEGMYFPFTME